LFETPIVGIASRINKLPATATLAIPHRSCCRGDREARCGCNILSSAGVLQYVDLSITELIEIHLARATGGEPHVIGIWRR
jgi:hypothetical protein